MRIGLSLKLFLLTTALCTFILATIFIGQMLFFNGFYVERKTNDIKISMETFQKDYLKNSSDVKERIKLKDKFYNDYNSWITVVDANGNIKGENDFNIEVNINNSKVPNSKNESTPKNVVVVPLFNLMNINTIWNNTSLLKEDMSVKIVGLKRGQKIIPVEISSSFPEPIQNDELQKSLNSDLYSFIGDITNVTIPNFGTVSKSLTTNDLFLNKIREFQSELLTNQLPSASSSEDSGLMVRNFENNEIEYTLLIQPFKTANGSTDYIISMTSLQPLSEAINMMKDYYVYIVIFVFILILLASFYYSRKIAKPLLQINKTTKKITNLDFTEKLPITSKDEIGEISENINALSDTLQSYIAKLMHDIEKERQLESTRKQFISGVSHELKTPLSVMQSCISILRDGVARHKRDYYFVSMEKEVKKMNRLIVDMLELAKLESGTYKMKMESFYINEMIAYLCNTQSVEMEKRHLKLSLKLLPLKVVANELKIEQVLTNFITNAISHTPEEGEIIISVTEEKERVRIAIENTGVSIPTEDLDKVWGRFYSHDPSRKRKQSGTGLGLAISKNILELHQAKYGVQNTQTGVLFYFYLIKSHS
ncbi:HAMP domain-containing histidine kinase [Aquibacillus sp. 3ASR75-11]|uniref:histidine kinase n=1 Tax=Terrihalobacillus insolitus TaxID=2950438 RepID=A0A9X3WQY0_9BACI|nr:HAMP domain-containing sensor histidine kinase [Terrihalobacillus insolitus]MDC3424452.1 HAMP domain-containing histidine kinase [Terrihalobacillus insolitus]